MPYITKRKVCLKESEHKAKEASTQHNNRWSKYYQNRQWKLLRDYYMKLHPICADCAMEGRSVPAEECHHKVPFSSGATHEEKMQLLLDPDNLVALCRECHMKRHGYLKDR